MRLSLEVLASTSIRRKKPWPQLAWLGKERENLFLVDKHRLSVLYVPSGKTKRKISKLHTILPTVSMHAFSHNGQFMVGLQGSGIVFVWHQDSNLLKVIQCLPEQLLTTPALQGSVRSRIAISDAGSEVVIVDSAGQMFVWEMDAGHSFFCPKTRELKGSWSHVTAQEGVPLPNSDARESQIAIRFHADAATGKVCECSFVFFVRAEVCIATVTLQWLQPACMFAQSSLNFRAHWTWTVYPLHQVSITAAPIKSRGALVARVSQQVALLVIALNQKHPCDNQLLFVSSPEGAVVAVDMKSCGLTGKVASSRAHWVADLHWTADGVFVVGISKHGSVFLCSRLGQLLCLDTYGCSMEREASLFLPLHPLISVRSCAGNRHNASPTSSVVSDDDIMRQRFSVAVHPSFPVILASDGYMVTIMQLPAAFNEDLQSGANMSSETLLTKQLLMEASSLLSPDGTASPTTKPWEGTPLPRKRFAYEKPDRSLETTQDSSSTVSSAGAPYTGHFSNVSDLDSGRVLFGADAFRFDATSPRRGATDASQELARRTALSTAFSPRVAAGSAHWHTADPSLLPDAAAASTRHPGLLAMLTSVTRIAALVRFNARRQHLLPSFLQLLRGTLAAILESEVLKSEERRETLLTICHALLCVAGRIVTNTFSHAPQLPAHALPHHVTVATAENGDMMSSHQPLARLAMCWKMLYCHTAHHFVALSRLRVSRYASNTCKRVLCSAQQHLQELGCEFPSVEKPKLDKGILLYMGGHVGEAIARWKHMYFSIATQGRRLTRRELCRMSRLAHAVLYAHILHMQLRPALDFVNALLIDDPHSGTCPSQELLVVESDTSGQAAVTLTRAPPDANNNAAVRGMRCRAVRVLARSLARFMAAYFTGRRLAVYPPTHPLPLPAAHGTAAREGGGSPRRIEVSREKVTSTIPAGWLDDYWTVDTTAELLVITGLIPEAVEFAKGVGDWKAAVALAASHLQHQTMLAELHPHRSTASVSRLPSLLHPAAILKEKLTEMLQLDSAIEEEQAAATTSNTGLTAEQATSSLREILTAGLLARSALPPGGAADAGLAAWLLAALLGKLKRQVQQLAVFVPEPHYLPAPPVFCPQPSLTEEPRNPSIRVKPFSRFPAQVSEKMRMLMKRWRRIHLDTLPSPLDDDASSTSPAASPTKTPCQLVRRRRRHLARRRPGYSTEVTFDKVATCDDPKVTAELDVARLHVIPLHAAAAASAPVAPSTGSRPYETDAEFLGFLDTAYAVCYGKREDDDDVAGAPPLLPRHAARVLAAASITDASAVSEKPPRLARGSAGMAGSVRSPAAGQKQSSSSLSPQRSHLGSKFAGLFRSLSWSNVSKQASELAATPILKKFGSQGTLKTARRSVTFLPDSAKIRPARAAPRIASPAAARHRSYSWSDLPQVAPRESRAPLASPLRAVGLPEARLGDRHARLLALVRWFVAWTQRRHLLGTPTRATTSVMHVHLSADFVVHGLWLSEQQRETTIASAATTKSSKRKLRLDATRTPLDGATECKAGHSGNDEDRASADDLTTESLDQQQSSPAAADASTSTTDRVTMATGTRMTDGVTMKTSRNRADGVIIAAGRSTTDTATVAFGATSAADTAATSRVHPDTAQTSHPDAGAAEQGGGLDEASRTHGARRSVALQTEPETMTSDGREEVADGSGKMDIGDLRTDASVSEGECGGGGGSARRERAAFTFLHRGVLRQADVESLPLLFLPEGRRGMPREVGRTREAWADFPLLHVPGITHHVAGEHARWLPPPHDVRLKPTHGFGQERMHEHPKHSYVERDYIYEQPKHMYAQREHVYAQREHMYAQREHVHEPPKHMYAQQEHVYKQPKHMYAQREYVHGPTKDKPPKPRQIPLLNLPATKPLEPAPPHHFLTLPPEGAAPRLVPPGDIIAYEQKVRCRLAEGAGSRRERAAADREPPLLAVRLDAWQARDERARDARVKRRSRRDVTEAPPAADVAPPAADVAPPVAEVKRPDPPTLDSGYVLPLNEPPSLSDTVARTGVRSPVDLPSYAAAQYRVAVAMPLPAQAAAATMTDATPTHGRERAVRVADAATSPVTSPEEALALEREVGMPKEDGTAEKERAAKAVGLAEKEHVVEDDVGGAGAGARAFAPHLPVDILLGLRAEPTGAAEPVAPPGGRVINIVDLGPEAVAEIMGSLALNEERVDNERARLPATTDDIHGPYYAREVRVRPSLKEEEEATHVPLSIREKGIRISPRVQVEGFLLPARVQEHIHTSPLIQGEGIHTSPHIQEEGIHTSPIIQEGGIHTSPFIQEEGIHTSPLIQGEGIHTSPLIQGEGIHTLPLIQGEGIHTSSLIQGEGIHTSHLIQEEGIHTSPHIQEAGIHTSPLIQGEGIHTSPLIQEEDITFPSHRKEKEVGLLPHMQERRSICVESDVGTCEGGDEVTTRLLLHDFNTRYVDDFEEDSMNKKSRASMDRRLKEMDRQLNAVDEIAHKVEQECADTKQLLQRANEITESCESARSRSGPPRADVVHRTSTPVTSLDSFPSLSLHVGQSSSRHPRGVGGSMTHGVGGSMTRVLEEKQANGWEAREGEASTRGQQGGRSAQAGMTSSGHDLSGLSDILAEVIHTIKPDDIGVTEEQMHQLEAKWGAGAKSLTPRADAHSMERRRQLHAWMLEKRRERTAEYRSQRQQLAATERKPYASPSQRHLSTSDLLADTARRSTERRGQFELQRTHRKRQAVELLSDLLATSPPTARDLLATSPPTARDASRTGDHSTKPAQGISAVTAAEQGREKWSSTAAGTSAPGKENRSPATERRSAGRASSATRRQARVARYPRDRTRGATEGRPAVATAAWRADERARRLERDVEQRTADALRLIGDLARPGGRTPRGDAGFPSGSDRRAVAVGGATRRVADERAGVRFAAAPATEHRTADISRATHRGARALWWTQPPRKGASTPVKRQVYGKHAGSAGSQTKKGGAAGKKPVPKFKFAASRAHRGGAVSGRSPGKTIERNPIASGTVTLNRRLLVAGRPAHKPRTYAQILQDLQPRRSVAPAPTPRARSSRRPPPPSPTSSVESEWSVPSQVERILEEGPLWMDESLGRAIIGLAPSAAPRKTHAAASDISSNARAAPQPAPRVTLHSTRVITQDRDDEGAAPRHELAPSPPPREQLDASVHGSDGVRVDTLSSGRSVMSCIDWDAVERLIADVS
ncbi:PREDICTED: uncharacterized protein LOC106808190 [Priapulus caudatus]|uniref:Uncharacterized protein LOC106808190 n=1 Tax=Priapulus caudatus TaxID=37621 RepID=A0ABM1E258_PRICU|nr:PREDICTED: uncharacterized protein LOC106808190 [Priapulus caudatus]